MLAGINVTQRFLFKPTSLYSLNVLNLGMTTLVQRLYAYNDKTAMDYGTLL